MYLYALPWIALAIAVVALAWPEPAVPVTGRVLRFDDVQTELANRGFATDVPGTRGELGQFRFGLEDGVTVSIRLYEDAATPRKLLERDRAKAMASELKATEEGYASEDAGVYGLDSDQPSWCQYFAGGDCERTVTCNATVDVHENYSLAERGDFREPDFISALRKARRQARILTTRRLERACSGETLTLQQVAEAIWKERDFAFAVSYSGVGYPPRITVDGARRASGQHPGYRIKVRLFHDVRTAMQAQRQFTGNERPSLPEAHWSGDDKPDVRNFIFQVCNVLVEANLDSGLYVDKPHQRRLRQRDLAEARAELSRVTDGIADHCNGRVVVGASEGGPTPSIVDGPRGVGVGDVVDPDLQPIPVPTDPGVPAEAVSPRRSP